MASFRVGKSSLLPIGGHLRYCIYALQINQTFTKRMSMITFNFHLNFYVLIDIFQCQNLSGKVVICSTKKRIIIRNACSLLGFGYTLTFIRIWIIVYMDHKFYAKDPQGVFIRLYRINSTLWTI